MTARVFGAVAALGLSATLITALAIAGVWVWLDPQLPSVDSLREARFQIPMRIYSRDDRLMAEFGEKRHEPVRLSELPPLLPWAFLSAEDDRFYEHPGVDWQGVLRAGLEFVRTGEKRQGGSTITMQVARNFFLGREKTWTRKLSEMMLAMRIERTLSKDEILELYLNKIFLGNHAYGVGAAARVYFGVAPGGLSIGQMALIAGLPRAPSSDNPLASPERARQRRDYVLRRMRELGHIDADTERRESSQPVVARRYEAPVEVDAPHVAEWVRHWLVERFGEEAYTRGLKVRTTLDGRLQPVAQRALEQGLSLYERRHAWRGPEARSGAVSPQVLAKTFAAHRAVGSLLPAVVLAAGNEGATLTLADGTHLALDAEALAWTRRAAPGVDATLRVGDVVRVRAQAEGGYALTQLPRTQAAFVAIDPADGAVRALAGGFAFASSKFNRVTQAQRQPGSGFKPFLYLAAMDAGFTPATVINDAPIVIDEPGMPEAWRPENYTQDFRGPMRLREALAQSRNLVSIRLLREVGMRRTLDYLERIGFDRARLPRNLTLALGTLTATPLEMAEAYAMLANGGHRVGTWIVERVEDMEGRLLYEAAPSPVCPPLAVTGAPVVAPQRSCAPRVIEPETHYLVHSMLQDVVRVGTGQAVRTLGRNDLAGKTGTTNEQRDAWFFGYHPTQVAVAWVGNDQYEPLGDKETGGRAALPIWMAYMQEFLRDTPEQPMPVPPGLTRVRIDPGTGLAASGVHAHAIFEWFPVNRLPHAMPEETQAPSDTTATPAADRQLEEALF